MFLKKVLNRPNLVGTMLITLMVCAGFVYAFAFDGFNVETATQGDVEAWLAAASGGGSGGGAVCTCGNAHCTAEVSVWKDGVETKVTKHGCKSDNACNGQIRKYPCPANASCRRPGGGPHKCTQKGCEPMLDSHGNPSKIDVCKKSPKKSCKGKC